MKALIAVLGLLISTSALADVYKCKNASGKFEFQELPCPTTALEQVKLSSESVPENKTTRIEKELTKRTWRDDVSDDLEKTIKEMKLADEKFQKDFPTLKLQQNERDRRTTEIMKVQSEKKRKEQDEKLAVIKTCIKDGCSADTYSYRLRELANVDVENVFGNCQNQKIGTTQFLYCSAKIVDAGRSRTARLQMEIIGYKIYSVNVY
ncbi:DUF4124 domain-containing protein [Undibacterium sp. Xuan67W]|uniref:DUF4124 domain-containing protein n=1 Tax=Undibacterium sp. Xuan67W TaxID=3413057 RepID=UPI003BF1B722